MTTANENNRSSPSSESSTSEPRSSNRERTAPRRWSSSPTIKAYPEGRPITHDERLFASLDADQIPSRALAVADDLLVNLFDDPRNRLFIRTTGRPDISSKDSTLLKEHFRAAFRIEPGYPKWRANDLTKQMQSHGIVSKNQDDATAFYNLILRYAFLGCSKRVKLSHTLMTDRVEACIVATSRIRRGTLILELGGLMSADAIEKPSMGGLGKPKGRRGRRKSTPKVHPTLQPFSLVWKGRGQTGPGPKQDRLLLGPARFVNHSCIPNCKLKPYENTNAWGIESIRPILPDEEITVNYGQHYFAPGECACIPCRDKGAEGVNTPATSLSLSPPPPSPSSRKRKPQEKDTAACDTPRPRKKMRR